MTTNDEHGNGERQKSEFRSHSGPCLGPCLKNLGLRGKVRFTLETHSHGWHGHTPPCHPEERSDEGSAFVPWESIPAVAAFLVSGFRALSVSSAAIRGYAPPGYSPRHNKADPSSLRSSG